MTLRRKFSTYFNSLLSPPVQEANGSSSFEVHSSKAAAPAGPRVPQLEHEQLSGASQATQLLLRLRYKELARGGGPALSFSDVEFRAFSQNREDGILLYIFSVIGESNRVSVEICAGDGIECNTANLLINHGWKGLLVDGDQEHVRRGTEFYAQCRDTCIRPPKFVEAWVTAENVNEIIRRNGIQGEIDLLSLDLDGIDYWIWKAIDVIRPRVVVLEYQNIWGPDEAVTVPYDPEFRLESDENGPNYCGASLAAFVKLGRERGYRLVGCEHLCFNAFFVRDDEGSTLLPEVPAAGCFSHPHAIDGIRERLPMVLHRPWERV